jgi:hypothetical protein
LSWTLLFDHRPSQVRLKVHHRKFVAIEVELLNISDHGVRSYNVH